jgi:hypothetical protein
MIKFEIFINECTHDLASSPLNFSKMNRNNFYILLFMLTVEEKLHWAFKLYDQAGSRMLPEAPTDNDPRPQLTMPASLRHI